jgi:GT2 family glycosyltransferase
MSSLKNEPPLVSVIVANHNRAALLEECLSSLLEQSYPQLEILVVDNGSTDSSCNLVASLKDDRVHLIPLQRNLGFGGGCNEGIRRARGQLIAFLNNDAVAAPGWIANLVQGLSKKRVGMCASKIVFSESGHIDKVGHLIYFDGQNRGRGTGEQDLGQYDQMEETIFPDGCAALYRREMLDDVGGFDEDFFAYADDADLGLRGRLRGWECIYVPDALVLHRHSSTTGSYSIQKIYWVERNRFWLAVKSFPGPLLLLNPFFTLYRWFWNVLAAILGKGAAGHFRREHSIWLLAKTILRAYGDGLKGLRSSLKKRKQIRRQRYLSDLDFYRLIWKFRISASVLANRDR